jgi:predicted RNase H-like HicB family nuclease
MARPKVVEPDTQGNYVAHLPDALGKLAQARHG